MLIGRSTSVNNVGLNEILKKRSFLIAKTYRDLVAVTSKELLLMNIY